MPVYATPDDLAGLDSPPTDPEPWLVLASVLVERATMTAIYRTDDDGLPIHAGTREAFRAATVAQVAYWQALDLDPTLGSAGVTGKRLATSKSIGSASVSYESSERATSDRAASLTQLGPAALAALGWLARGPVIVHG